MIIAVDAMGGDLGPAEIVKGIIAAVKEFEVKIIIVGIESVIRELLDNYKDYDRSRIEILHADDVITMEDTPTAALKHKKNSSIAIGINAVKNGQADCFISTGNTGAVMACATMRLGRLEGIDRPGIAVTLPTPKKALLL